MTTARLGFAIVLALLASKAEAGPPATARRKSSALSVTLGVASACRHSSRTASTCSRRQSQMKTLYPDMNVALNGLPPGAAFATKQDAGDFKMVAYVITAAPDPVIEMTSQYHTGGSRNYGRFSDPNLDALLDKAIVELNADRRTQLLDEFQQKFNTEWMPNFVLHANPVRNILPGSVGGYDKSAGTWYGYSSWTKPARWFYLNK